MGLQQKHLIQISSSIWYALDVSEEEESWDELDGFPWCEWCGNPCHRGDCVLPGDLPEAVAPPPCPECPPEAAAAALSRGPAGSTHPATLPRGPARGHRAAFLPRGSLDTTCRREPSRGFLNAARHNNRPSKTSEPPEVTARPHSPEEMPKAVLPTGPDEPPDHAVLPPGPNEPPEPCPEVLPEAAALAPCPEAPPDAAAAPPLSRAAPKGRSPAALPRATPRGHSLLPRPETQLEGHCPAGPIKGAASYSIF
ncbi:hypothetical protein SKAU_G00020230 [Synaphobranchus kaupii]|uniref:Uncharacterized protein n=1 Tax=Synaphobranchus kaupii TaxID=118154 RepID=A0A9Q1GBQ5_SYNKA|nr:hypothetical protein SKAU_G00020230 [Synaphobranchus kaupii]